MFITSPVIRIVLRHPHCCALCSVNFRTMAYYYYPVVDRNEFLMEFYEDRRRPETSLKNASDIKELQLELAGRMENLLQLDAEDIIPPTVKKKEEEIEVMEDGKEEEKNKEKQHDFFGAYPIIMRENQMGMTITSGGVTIKKDTNNLIGISIGGGYPLCPCLYIVQIFDNTAASRDGTLQSGDELVSVNGQSVKGKSKTEVAKMIQAAKEEVTINYNKLHADPKQGKSLDIILKKMKHRLVENMSSSTADALGLSRAILCNDTLVKKMQELQDTELMYKGLVEHCKGLIVAHLELSQTVKAIGDVFGEIAAREPQQRASEAFRVFGEQHRQMETASVKILKEIKPVIKDMGTYLYKAIPDTRLTVKKYADAKFEYLAYCLKVKEMDDEECSYAALQEPLYRVETGNYEYRLILRCRQMARAKFAKLRSDVLVKMELLDSKHVQSLGGHLSKLIKGLAQIHSNQAEVMSGPCLFPVEVDLTNNAFQYKSTTPLTQENEDDDDELCIENGEEVNENEGQNLISDLLNFSCDDETSFPISNNPANEESPMPKEPNYDVMDNLTLLSTLNIQDQSSVSSRSENALIPNLD